MMDVESRPAAETEFPVENEQPRELPTGWQSGHARLLALFGRLARNDQQEILAVAQQKLRLRWLLPGTTEERGNEFLRDE